MTERDKLAEAREALTMRVLLKAHEAGESMGIWGWVHATRALEPFIPEDGPLRGLWGVMARHDADTCRNDWLGLVDDILREREASARAEGAAEAFERAAKVADSMLGNPSPDAWPNVRDGSAWNAACMRTGSAIRALAEKERGA